jgi:hypothetical protein
VRGINLRRALKSKTSTWVAIISFSVFVCSGNLAAKERRGVEVVIQTQNGQQVRGELIVVKQNSLLLLDSRSGADVSVDIVNIVLVKIVKKSKAGQGALFGFLAGAGLGAINAAADKVNREEDPWQNFWESTFDVAAFVFLVLTGTIVGLTIGSVMCQNRDQAAAPSTLAASTSSSGTCRKNCRKIRVAVAEAMRADHKVFPHQERARISPLSPASQSMSMNAE